MRQMPCALLELNIDLLWNNVLRAINSRIHNIHRYHGKLLADSCTSGSRIRALWHVITKQNSKLFWAHCTQSIQSYRKRICMLSQITLHISTHVHCMSQKHFHSHLVMSMFSLKVMRELSSRSASCHVRQTRHSCNTHLHPSARIR
jgi:hypothetical protein